MFVGMTKKELRQAYRKERDQLSMEQAALNDLAILQQLKSIDWKAYTYVHVFVPISRLKEPNIWSILSFLKDNFPHVKVLVSRSDFDKGEMIHYVYDEQLPLLQNAYGILEPTAGEVVHSEKIDLVLIPLLVCDIRGNRVGYGKGFYDRFLATCRASCYKLGIAYFPPVAPIADMEAHDIPLDACVVNDALFVFPIS